MYKVILLVAISLGLACKSIQGNKSKCYESILAEFNPNTNWVYNAKLEYYEDKFPFYKITRDTLKHKCIINQKLDTTAIVKLFGTPSYSALGVDSVIYFSYCTYPPQGIKQCCQTDYTFRFSKFNILYEITDGACTAVN
jgi:hypothetical protein